MLYYFTIIYILLISSLVYKIHINSDLRHLFGEHGVCIIELAFSN